MSAILGGERVVYMDAEHEEPKNGHGNPPPFNPPGKARMPIKTAAASADGSKAYLYISTNAATKYAYGPCWVDFGVETAVDGAVTISGTLAANGSWGLNL